MPSTSQNYELWDTNRFLGVWRDVKSDPLYWTQFYTSEILSEDEYIDFEKMPIQNRKMAPFVRPLDRGPSIYDDQSTSMRFKPAYAKLRDEIDPLMPLRRRVGIDSNMSQAMAKLNPMQRLDLIRMQMSAAHVRGVERTFNYMAAIALRDGAITLSGKAYPTRLVDFQRAANHTITLTAGNRFGDAGISIVDFVQLVLDRMTNADFGGVPTRVTMGGGVWNVLRKNAEVLEHMDINIKGGNITVERGLVSGDTVFKVGTMFIGGGSGQSIELWVDNSTFTHPETGVTTRYIGNHQMLFTASPDAINGFQAFGRIIDRKANYAPMRMFPKNWMKEGDTDTEYMSIKSAPIFAPLNPNATLLANVIAP